MREHLLKQMIRRRQGGHLHGIPSYCTANKLVLETILARIRETGQPALIEATANQVNQYGGYTGMTPEDFMVFIKEMIRESGTKEQLVILGGDHLGPLTWSKDPAAEAMEKAKKLVSLFVAAGFTKIHLDTSMKLGDDPLHETLSTGVIAERGVELYCAGMEAYREVLKKNPDAVRPVFVIGSEVPIPGGAQSEEEEIAVTIPEELGRTVRAYREAFETAGVPEGWQDIIAVVVQPGVEFGDNQVFLYNRKKAAGLCEKLKQYPELVLEGHSTDYQTREALREMVEDGVSILKVGPALTFGLREGIYALSMMEKELIVPEKRANVMEILEDHMLNQPQNWIAHYHGTEAEIALARKYSFSDRSRYYLGGKAVEAAIDKLCENLSHSGIPISMLHQYMPVQYEEVLRGRLAAEPKQLIQSSVRQFMRDYEFAAGEFGEVGGVQ